MGLDCIQCWFPMDLKTYYTKWNLKMISNYLWCFFLVSFVFEDGSWDSWFLPFVFLLPKSLKWKRTIIPPKSITIFNRRKGHCTLNINIWNNAYRLCYHQSAYLPLLWMQGLNYQWQWIVALVLCFYLLHDLKLKGNIWYINSVHL